MKFLKKLLYKKERGLEQRIFIIFFIVTIIFVIILIVVEWQLARYIIWQYENKKINESISKIKLAKLQYDNEALTELKKIEKELKNKEILNNELILDIHKFFANKEKHKSTYFALYNNDNELIAGEKWDFIEKYKLSIAQKISQKQVGVFQANDNKKIYSIKYMPIYGENLKAYLICVDKFAKDELHLNDVNFDIYSYPLTEKIENLIQIKPFQLPKVSEKIEYLVKKNKSSDIIRLDGKLALGTQIFYDINHNPTTLYVKPYTRDFNIFVKNSILMILLIILSLSLVIISLFGNWFGKSIIRPIRTINQKMMNIAQNPTSTGFIPEKYSGEFGDMIKTFNKMNFSISEFSKSLMEYKLIIENLNSGVFWLDENLEIILCNYALMDIFEIKKTDSIIGKKITEYLPLKKSIINKPNKDNIRIPNLKLKDNIEKFVLLNLKRVKNGSLKFVGSVTDITEEVRARNAREALELELIKSDKLAEIGRRVEGVIHNLNSPLNSILGYAQLIKKGLQEHEDIDKVIKSGKVLAHYVKTLQQKIQQEEISMIRSLNINELIKKEVEFCQHNLFFKHQVTLKMRLTKNLPKIDAVYSDISACFDNILNNAIESLEGRKKKNITLKTSKNEHNIIVEIKDTGKGIKEKNISKIFQPYFTTKSKKRSSSGFGLGLAISKRIIEKYKGNIGVKSQINVGSTFTLKFPI